MKIIALEEHFIMPREEQNLPPGAHRGNDREKLLGFDVIAELLDLGKSRLAAMDAAGIDVQVLSHNQPGCQALDADAAIPVARETDYPAAPLHSDTFSADFIGRAQILPLAQTQEGLALAMADPTDLYTLKAVRLAAGTPVLPWAAVPSEQRKIITSHDAAEITQPVANDQRQHQQAGPEETMKR
jgi:hypothetical protein